MSVILALLLRQGKLEKLTRDHTLAEHLRMRVKTSKRITC
jgi:serine/threonine protein phosphatase PrpC